MRRLRLILGVGLLAIMLSVGVVACDDDEDNGDNGDNGEPTAEETMDDGADDGDMADETPADDMSGDETPEE